MATGVMRALLAALALVLLVAVLGGIKGCQIATLIGAGKKMAAAGPPPKAVGVAIAGEQEWQDEIATVGSISPRTGVTISNELAGTVTRLPFASGDKVKRGQVLAVLEANVERAQLASARARRALAEDQLRRSQRLVATGSIAVSQLQADESAWKAADADVGAFAGQIDRKTIRAPFDGRVGIRLVNLGQYLAPGTAITVIDATDALFADFTVPQQDLSRVGIGMPVRIAIGEKTLDAKVDAIDPGVDLATRAAKIRANVANADPALRPGMFVRVTVLLPTRPKVVVVPGTAVVRAPYGDSVFVVEDKDGGKIARQQLVRVGEARGDFVSVVDGVAAGQTVVSAGAFKLRNGARVAPNPNVKPDPELAPSVQNR